MTWHDFLIIETSWNKHRGMTWLKYITIHPRINIELQYIRNTDEYISKLQLHQHIYGGCTIACNGSLVWNYECVGFIYKLQWEWMWAFTVGVLSWTLSIDWKSYDSVYFVVCTYIIILVLKIWSLSYNHAIAGNGTLFNSELCKIMVKCCLMVITGFVYLFVN